MKRKIYIVIIIVFFIICLGSIESYARENEKDNTINIVVIHSYHLGYQWTYNQNEGLRSEILAKYPDANIFTEFLDWKRFPDEKLILDKEQEFRDKYKDMDIDLLMVTDDRGLQFAIQCREEIFDNAPIVFGGIIETTANEIIGDARNITGVYENMHPEGVINLLRTLQPEVDHLVLIHDLSESGIRTNNLFLQALKNVGVENEYQISEWSDKTYSEIQNEIGSLDQHTVIIFNSYAMSSDGVIKTPQTFCELFSEKSSVPMYSVDEHQFGYGIIGGTFLSGILHGNDMGRLAIRILNGESADSISSIKNATVYTGVDNTYIKKYGLNKNLLDSDIIIINKDESFYHKYKVLVNTTLAVFGLLLVFIIILIWLQIKLRRSRAQLLVSKNTLQVLNKELQESKEELTAQKEELEKIKVNLEFENEHDYLTGLHNRSALETYLNDQIEKISVKDKLIVIFIDLDNFKFVNNTYGHHLGDELLMQVGKRLKIIDRELYLSRTGGDEFVLVKIFHDQFKDENLNSMLLRIVQSIIKEFIIGENKISITASIGYSMCPDNGTTFEQLMIEADMAMYQAKKNGKSALKKYVTGMNDLFQNEYLMTNKIKEGLDKEEFFVNYQPIVNSDGSTLVSFEVLLRWKNEEMGLVSPVKFISIAESSGLILPIGRVVFEKSFAFYQRLQDKGFQNIKLSINVSIVQFYQDKFIEDLVSMTKTYGINPNYMQLEITENIMIEAYEYIIEKLKELKAQGFSIALDDFGTGFSSLSYLQKLPIDVIKIDKSFTDQIEENGESVLVDATISLAKKFSLKTVAEGVETKEQVDYLIGVECEYIQGYYYSKPLSEEDALEFAAGIS